MQNPESEEEKLFLDRSDELGAESYQNLRLVCHSKFLQAYVKRYRTEMYGQTGSGVVFLENFPLHIFTVRPGSIIRPTGSLAAVLLSANTRHTTVAPERRGANGLDARTVYYDT